MVRIRRPTCKTGPIVSKATNSAPEAGNEPSPGSLILARSCLNERAPAINWMECELAAALLADLRRCRQCWRSTNAHAAGPLMVQFSEGLLLARARGGAQLTLFLSRSRWGLAHLSHGRGRIIAATIRFFSCRIEHPAEYFSRLDDVSLDALASRRTAQFFCICSNRCTERFRYHFWRATCLLASSHLFFFLAACGNRFVVENPGAKSTLFRVIRDTGRDQQKLEQAQEEAGVRSAGCAGTDSAGWRREFASTRSDQWISGDASPEAVGIESAGQRTCGYISSETNRRAR